MASAAMAAAAIRNIVPSPGAGVFIAGDYNVKFRCRGRLRRLEK
jgi:hypothetical protein